MGVYDEKNMGSSWGSEWKLNENRTLVKCSRGGLDTVNKENVVWKMGDTLGHTHTGKLVYTPEDDDISDPTGVNVLQHVWDVSENTHSVITPARFATPNALDVFEATEKDHGIVEVVFRIGGKHYRLYYPPKLDRSLYGKAIHIKVEDTHPETSRERVKEYATIKMFLQQHINNITKISIDNGKIKNHFPSDSIVDPMFPFFSKPISGWEKVEEISIHSLSDITLRIIFERMWRKLRVFRVHVLEDSITTDHNKTISKNLVELKELHWGPGVESVWYEQIVRAAFREAPSQKTLTVYIYNAWGGEPTETKKITGDDTKQSKSQRQSVVPPHQDGPPPPKKMRTQHSRGGVYVR